MLERLEDRRLLAANLQPTFTATDPPSVLEDSAQQVIAGFATFDAGSTDESDQSVLGYSVANLSNPDLFSALPTINNAGDLVYTPAANAFGTATFDISVQDDGGTAEGGIDTSEIQAFTISVTAVNDAPTFVAGGEVTVLEDAGQQVIAQFATSFDPGPGESGASTDTQTLHDEGTDGLNAPLSVDNNNPTNLGSLAHGSNVVKGLTEQAKSVGNVDVFTFTVEPGFQLSGLFVDQYEYLVEPSANERNAFLAINDAATFPYNAFDLDINANPDFDESQFLGGTIFGLNDLPSAGGGDILQRAGQITGRRFTGPLPAGTYTVYIQQTGPANKYSLDFQVTETFAQTIAGYSITNVSDPSLFAAQPFVDASGSLSFRPADDAFGTATFDVAVQDDGGRTNGGVDTATIQQATITITSVNDEPSFAVIGEVATNEDSERQVVSAFATNFDPGPGETGESANSVTLHAEGTDGLTAPLSTDNNQPTDLGMLSHGSNLVQGVIESAKNIGNVDVFTFTVDTGYQLSGLFVDQYEYVFPPAANERNAFLAINDAATFPYNAFDLDLNANPDFDESLFLGGTVFGLSDLPSDGGGNILSRAGRITGRRFTGPLPAGTYTVYIQQTGPANSYTLDFQVEQSFAQTNLGYTVANISDASLFEIVPFVDSEGNLSYTPAADAFGTATFDLTVQDSGGTDTGGADISAARQGTITINPVNDRPTFAVAQLPAIDRDAGSQTVAAFASGLSLGPPNESGQSLVAYGVSNLSESGFFLSTPLIDNDGNLTYTVTDGVSGIITFDVTARDDGGSENGGVDISNTQTLTLVVNDLIDFGDAPQGYPVTLAENGARHSTSVLKLGGQVDADSDGTHSANADADSDDDGLIDLATLIASANANTTSSFTVYASAAGRLDAWIDFNADHDWDDVGEQIATNVPLSFGSNTLNFTVPASVASGDKVARFRISSAGSLLPTGPADDGEVEDYLIAALDGTNSPTVSIRAIDLETVLMLADDQLRAESNQQILFEAPTANIGRFQWQGNNQANTFVIDFSSGSPILPGGLTLLGNGQENTLRLTGANATLDLTQTVIEIAGFSIVDLRNGNADRFTLNTATAQQLNPAEISTLSIEGDSGDEILFQDASEWRISFIGTEMGSAHLRATTLSGNVIIDIALPNAWHNVVQASDINNNGQVTAVDALLIINELGRNAYSDPSSGMLDSPGLPADWADTYYDQNNDGSVSALDALRVINQLARSFNEPGLAENEFAPLPQLVVSLDFASSATANRDSHVSTLPAELTVETKQWHQVPIQGKAESTLPNTDVQAENPAFDQPNGKDGALLPSLVDQVHLLRDWA